MDLTNVHLDRQEIYLNNRCVNKLPWIRVYLTDQLINYDGSRSAYVNIYHDEENLKSKSFHLHKTDRAYNIYWFGQATRASGTTPD